MKNTLKVALLFTFCSLISYFAAMHFSSSYPENVTLFLQQQWIYPYISFLEAIFGILTISTLFFIWREKNYAVYALLGTVAFYFLMRWSPDLSIEYPIQSLTVDLLSISFGILLGIFLIKTAKFNLTNIQKLRIVCLLYLIVYGFNQIFSLGDDLLPRCFIEFVIADYHFAWVRSLLPLLPLAAYTILVDPYAPRNLFLRYINHKTIFVFLNILLLCTPQRDALTSWTCLVCDIWAVLLGMILILMWETRYSERISNSTIKLIEANN